MKHQFTRNFHTQPVTFIYRPSFYDCTASVSGIGALIDHIFHIWRGVTTKKTDIVKWKIKKLLRNFEGSNGSIFKKLWGLNWSAVSYKKWVYHQFFHKSIDFISANV